MKTKKNNRGETLVVVKNVDTGVVVWKRKDAYERSMKQWELTTDPLSDGPSQEELDVIALKEAEEARVAVMEAELAQLKAEKETREAEDAAERASGGTTTTKKTTATAGPKKAPATAKK